MTEIPFTQFLMPHGRREAVSIKRPETICTKAFAIIALGYRFEIEMLSTGEISMEICGKDEDVIASAICTNGPDVPACVDKMVNESYVTLFP